MAKRKWRTSSAEFKAEAVIRCKTSDRGQGQVAKDLDLTELALVEWAKRSEIDASQGPPEALTTDERVELTRRGSPSAVRRRRPTTAQTTPAAGSLGDLGRSPRSCEWY